MISWFFDRMRRKVRSFWVSGGAYEGVEVADRGAGLLGQVRNLLGVEDGLCVLTDGGADELALGVDDHEGLDALVRADAVDALVDLALAVSGRYLPFKSIFIKWIPRCGGRRCASSSRRPSPTRRASSTKKPASSTRRPATSSSSSSSVSAPPLKIDEKSAGLRDSYKTKLKEYLERAEYLKGVLKKASEPPPPVKAPGGGAGGADDAKE